MGAVDEDELIKSTVWRRGRRDRLLGEDVDEVDERDVDVGWDD